MCISHLQCRVNTTYPYPRITMLAAIGAVFGGLLCPIAMAAELPTGGHVTTGSATISESNNLMTVQQLSGSVAIDWTSFNIGLGDSVNFKQPNTSAIALNQILGQNPSSIFGSLFANGQVFLLNPNGILFGRTAQVNVGGLVASTLGLSDSDFLSGKYSFKGTSTAAGVSNLGEISSGQNGYLAFIGPQVMNGGVLNAPRGTIALGAGEQVTMTLSGHAIVGFTVDVGTLKALAANTQLIRADGGQVILTSRGLDAVLSGVVNNSGMIEARTVSDREGVIRLLASGGTAEVSGTLDASAPQGGNGGYIETDGSQVNIGNGAKVTTLATNGKTGTWLIDPTDFTVASSGGDLNGATLSSDLNLTNTTILSSNGVSPVTGGGSGGNINVNDSVSWSANTTLTLTASNNVNVNANMSATGNAAGLVINPNTANGGQAASGSGAFNLNMGNSITLSGANPSLSIGGTAYTVINTLGAPGSTTGTDLQGVNGNLSGFYALGSNIDATATLTWNSGAGFTPIGIPNGGFSGSFNGLGHTVTNLTINLPSNSNVGLFGFTASNSAIQNVGLVKGSVTGNNSVGELVGDNAGTVGNSYATGSVSGTSNSNDVGGLVGYNSNTVSNSYATGSVSGTSTSSFVGGLVGFSAGTMNNSYATGNVRGDSGSFAIGGLVGENVGTINNSYATGSVSGGTEVGGLVGIDLSSSGSVVSNSYASGSVSGSSNLGGLVGSNSQVAPITNSFWDITSSGQSTSAGGTGLTTAQMQTASNFTGFNFTSTPGGSGNNWVIVDADGTLNNAGGAAGATFPMLASEYATTINNAHQLQLMAMNPNASYTLGHNIDASATATGADVWGSSGFIPVGNANIPFTGAFNGLGNTILNLTINLPSNRNVGLFGYTAYGSELQNVGLVGGSVTGKASVGEMAGFNKGTIDNSYGTGSVSGNSIGSDIVGGLVGTNGGTISGSYASGSVNGGSGSNSEVGGLVGENGGTISGSYTTGSVGGGSGSSYVGGLVGYNIGSVDNSYATGSVSGTYYVGALLGFNGNSVNNTYATGSVSGSSDVGGLVGYNSIAVSNSYSTGAVSGSSNVGGLAGYNSGTVSNSFWDIITSGQPTSAGGTGLTTAQMQTASSFTGWSIASTGGSGGVWRIYAGNTYPLLINFLTPLTLTDAPDTTVTYNGSIQNGPSTAISGVLGAAATGSNAGFYNGYYSTQQGYDITGGNLTINPASLMLIGTRVYDGTPMVDGSILTAIGVAGQTFSVLGVGNLASKDVQNNSMLASVNGLALGSSNNGGLFGNYLPLNTIGSSVTITPLVLTGVSIAAGNSTYGSSVTPGVVTFGNVIGGDAVNSTASIASPLYSTSGNLRAGGYAQTASGLSGADAADYSFAGFTTPTNNYTVAQLALTGAGIAAGNSTYGSSVTPGVVTFSNVIAGDAVNSTASIASPLYSTSGHVNAGNYYQTASGLSGVDAGNYSFTGGFATGTQNYTVGQLALNLTGLTGSNKVYNGSNADPLRGTASIAPISGDVVNLGGIGSGSFADSNVGNAKPVTVSGYTLTGADAGNYLLVEPTALTANITQLASVAWVGGSSGNWSLATNWAGGALPDYANVAAVTIPVGDTVTYDGGVPGTTTLTTLTSRGNLVMAAGNLSTTGNLRTAGYTQSGGNLGVGGALTINSTSGEVTLGAITAGSLNITSQAGAISQLSSTSLHVIRTSNLTAPNSDITLADSSNIFGGAVTSNGSNIDLAQSTGALKLGNTTTSGTLTVASNGGPITQIASTAIDVSGTTNLSAGNGVSNYAITLANATNDFVGAVTSTGSNINLLDTSSGGLNLGNTIASGTLTATSRGGALAQAGSTAVDVTGATNLTANNGGALTYGITLANTTNDFVGIVTSNGSNISLLDSSTGGLKLGNTTASGALAATSSGGAITQAGSTAIDAGGSTSLTANNGGAISYRISLANAANNFGGTVTASGSAVSLDDAAALTAIIDSTGATVLTSAGALNVSGTVGTSLSTTTTGTSSATTFGATTVGTNLVVTSTGAVSETAPNILMVAGKGTTTVSNPHVTVNGVKGATIP